MGKSNGLYAEPRFKRFHHINGFLKIIDSKVFIGFSQ